MFKGMKGKDLPKAESRPASQTLRSVTDLRDAKQQLDRDHEPVVLEMDGTRLVVMLSDVFDRLVEGVGELVAKDLRGLEGNQETKGDQKPPDPGSWGKVREVLDAAREALSKIDSGKR